MKKTILFIVGLLVLVGCGSSKDVALVCKGDLPDFDGATIESVYKGKGKVISGYETKQVIPFKDGNVEQEDLDELIEEMKVEHDALVDDNFKYEISGEDKTLTFVVSIENIDEATAEQLNAAGLQIEGGSDYIGFDETKEGNESIGRTCEYLEADE